MERKANNKRIAKNTTLLYFRMIVTMIISLYTSRVILQILGVEDYGIYQAVGGIIGFLFFFNNALATGTSRFLAYGLGEGNKQKLDNTFSTAFTIHVIIAFIVIIIAETAGLWFMHHKMEIPEDRFDVAIFVFHLSVLTGFFSITQVPYSACIIAHEKMNVYAYMSIIEAVAKLLIVYALAVCSIDKLKMYAILLCALQICIMSFYRYYCSHFFSEARIKLFIDKAIFKKIGLFSGWSLMSSSAIALNNQGVLVLLNMFFSPAVVAARAVSLQLSTAATQLLSGFQTAAIPQIVKLYAASEYEESKRLLLQTARISYYLMLLVSLPIFLTAGDLLYLWLGIVPEYTEVFVKIIVIQCLFQVFDTSFYYPLYAKGQLKENAIVSTVLGFIQFPVVYILFKCGYSPIALSWASLGLYIILGIIMKPILVIKIASYNWKDVLSVLGSCFLVTIVSIIVPIIYVFLFNPYIDNEIVRFFNTVFISLLSVVLCVWFLGISKDLRKNIMILIKKKCQKDE